MAAMLVLIVVALATLISMAMLSSASLQSSVADSASRGAVADYMASSAIQVAEHYLQYSSKQPVSWGTRAGYKLYVTGATIPGVNGSFDLNVAATAKPDTYQINATGYSDSADTVTRSASAQIQLQRAMPSGAAGFGTGTFTIPLGYTFNGAGLVNGVLAIVGTLTGAITTKPGANDFLVPTLSTINHYGAAASPGSYTMPDGSTGVPQAVASPITSASQMNANANNPGKIFYVNGPLTIKTSSPLTLTGTLVILSNNLTVQNSNALSLSVATITINPQSGFPAIITDGNISLGTKNIGLVANGVVWVGGQISAVAAALNSSLTINGSLLVPNTPGLGTILPALATINYSAAFATVNNLNNTAQPIIGVKNYSSSQ